MNPVLIASTALLAAGLATVYWIHTRHFLDIVVETVPPPLHCPLISVCIPARNEARTIAACVAAAAGQTYPRFEVIAIDDASTDATPLVLADLQTQFPSLVSARGSPLPIGWAGKPHALYEAAALAHGSWLCFLDADTILLPDALASCYTKALETHADLFTILTHQTMETFWEKAVMPLVFTALSVGFPPRRVNNPRLADAIANGQFILIRREAYNAVGGHAQIRNQIVDDKALALLVKRSGRRLVLADGSSVARTRMYRSLGEMWEGWTKNIYLGLRDRPASLLLGATGALLLSAAAFALPLWPLLGWLGYVRGAGWAGLVIILEASLVWGVVIYARAQAAAGMGISRLYALTTPLGCAVFAAMMLASAWNVLSGRGVTWRGRTYTDV